MGMGIGRGALAPHARGSHAVGAAPGGAEAPAQAPFPSAGLAFRAQPRRSARGSDGAGGAGPECGRATGTTVAAMIAAPGENPST